METLNEGGRLYAVGKSKFVGDVGGTYTCCEWTDLNINLGFRVGMIRI